MSYEKRKSYTVKQLANLSGVSERTLRFYDKIGLLKPAFYGENGYRYYEREQLLELQQILFYRELGMKLVLIEKVMKDSEFDRIEALRRHREQLLTECERNQELIRTIDKTLIHLEDGVPLKDEEVYFGFDPIKQAKYEQEVIDRWGETARHHVEESRRRTKGWRKEDYDQVKLEFDELHHAFTDAIARGLLPGSKEVQYLVKRHYAIVGRFWTPDQKSYAGLGDLYLEHPDFQKLYESYHPKLAEYLAEAMRVFANQEL